MTPLIRIQNLSKCYELGDAPIPEINVTETLLAAARGMWRKLKSLAKPGGAASGNVFWALKDVSFDVQPGEVVGVIGRNGAGKSTLLKLLSRVTVPTTGRIEVRGRMGSLLEVGTGFHPGLTGRENIFLSGSILGMRRREILAKFDRIVSFAEIGPHLDTLVKRYSSGMYVRLAFAIAAHLEPESLIVDEVLAVGDATFQRRCIDRMSELSREGRTILFVSHNMQLIPQLCHRAVFLERGSVKQIGPAGAVTQAYLDRLLEDSRLGDLRDKPRTGDGRAKFVRAIVSDANNRPVAAANCGDRMTIRLDVESTADISDMAMNVTIQNLYGTRLISAWTRETGFSASVHVGIQSFVCSFPAMPLRPGQTVLFNLSLTTHSGVVIDAVDNAIVLDVIGDERHSHLGTSQDHGAIICEHTWQSLA